jgi:hypothetical protein
LNGADGVAGGASGNGGNRFNGVDGSAASTHGNGANGNRKGPRLAIEESGEGTREEVLLLSFLMPPFCLGIIFTSPLPFSKNNGKTFSKFYIYCVFQFL